MFWSCFRSHQESEGEVVENAAVKGPQAVSARAVCARHDWART